MRKLFRQVVLMGCLLSATGFAQANSTLGFEINEQNTSATLLREGPKDPGNYIGWDAYLPDTVATQSTSLAKMHSLTQGGFSFDTAYEIVESGVLTGKKINIHMVPKDCTITDTEITTANWIYTIEAVKTPIDQYYDGCIISITSVPNETGKICEQDPTTPDCIAQCENDSSLSWCAGLCPNPEYSWCATTPPVTQATVTIKNQVQ
jgi:hypothetical protein